MRSEVAKRILSKTPDEVRERVKQYAKQKVMEQQKIEQMNSVFAEYMGAEIKAKVVFLNGTGYLPVYDKYNQYCEYLRYDSSLDWLYPVWQKIINEYDLIEVYSVEQKKLFIDVMNLFNIAAPISELHEAIYNAIVWLKNNK